MTLSLQVLSEHLAPLRESTITALLTAQTRALDAGADIEPEPVQRLPDGTIKRSGLLNLPQRGDLSVTLDGRTLIQRVEGTVSSSFAPLNALTGNEFTAVIEPFAWDAACAHVTADVESPNWTPVRHWFLEWFQPRQTALSPELAGVAHSIEVNRPGLQNWRLDIDLGSAPFESVPALLAAISMTGCNKVTITEDD